MNVGITGHQHIDDDTAWTWVDKTISKILKFHKETLTGITSLAVGSDQLFARIVLTLGGSPYVVIPFPDYERTFTNPEDLRSYRAYIEASDNIETLDPSDSDELAYLAAGRRVVDLAEIMIAVWDGNPANGIGGTADIVNYALEKGTNIIQLNPIEHLMKKI